MKINEADLPHSLKTHMAPSIAGVVPAARRLAAGDWLFRLGDATFGIFFVVAGRLRMQRMTPDGEVVIMHVARPGEMLAEASLFVPRYQCDVIAETDCEVWTYPKQALSRSLRDDPESLWAFSAALARSLHGLRQRYELKQIRSAPDRVMQLLRLRCDDAGIYRTAGVLKEMAAELGLTHESLYRALAMLEKKGAIVRAKEQLQIKINSTPTRKDK